MYRDSTAKKIEEIQFLIATGKNRTEVAKALGYKDAKGLYRFTSRNNLKWNTEKQNYEATGNDGKPIEAVKPPADNPTGKVSNIISMFDRGIDGREIAKKLRFRDYQEMADYMKSKGYAWNDSKQNYVLQPQEIKEDNRETERAIEDNGQVTREAVKKIDPGTLEQYADLLMMLDANRDKLEELFKVDGNGSTSAILPRYIVSGISVVKTIGINNSIDQIVKEFCAVKCVSQKEFFEVAAIEALKKYGYVDEVKANLKV